MTLPAPSSRVVAVLDRPTFRRLVGVGALGRFLDDLETAWADELPAADGAAGGALSVFREQSFTLTPEAQVRVRAARAVLCRRSG